MKAPTKNSTKQEVERARDERLRAALRENLKRRKTQARGRAADGQDIPSQAPEAGATDGEKDE